MTKKLKTTICFCLCLLLMAGTLPPAMAAVLGDVTGDEDITAEDARGILRAAVGLDTLDEEAAAKADMDTDGAITAADARLALRTAVGLNLPVNEIFENQYDILRSGSYYMEINPGDMETMPLSCTITGDKKYISTQIPMSETGVIDFTFCFEGNDLWFVDEKHEVYTLLDEESLSFLGEEAGFLDEFSDLTDQIGVFGNLKPLSEADYQVEETFKDVPCVSYWFMGDDGTLKIYMDGAKLVGLVRTDARGRVVAMTEFTTISAVLPADTFLFTERYTPISDVFTFMMIAYGEALGGDLVSPEDIQKLIDEAKAEANKE